MQELCYQGKIDFKEQSQWNLKKKASLEKLGRILKCILKRGARV